MSQPGKPVGIRPDGTSPASFFAAVRQRGVLNSILDEPVKVFERLNPDMRARWEYYPPNGDSTLVVAREAMGYTIVDASEIAAEMGQSFAKSGPIRRGDLVMMAAPREVVDEEDAQDARAAAEDLKLPERTYRDALESNKVALSTGEVDNARPIGNVKTTVEEFRVQTPEKES